MRSFVWIFALIFSVSSSSFASNSVSCECESSSCGPCEVEVGTSFYSAKCGPGGSRVKSCKKPTCQAVENQRECLADLTDKVNSSPTQSLTAADLERTPASAPVAQKAGAVEEVQGEVRIVSSKKDLKPGDIVRVGDRVVSGVNGKARIRLEDGSSLMVAASSDVTIDVMDVDAAQRKRRVAMSLLSGKVRNRVDKSFGTDSKFEVKTRTAVAGVRGTDFVTSYDADDKKWVTKVQTIEGKVRLADVSQSDFLDDKDPSPVSERLVEAGTAVAFVVAAPEKDDEASVKKAISEGLMGPSLILQREEIEKLSQATEFAAIQSEAKIDRSVASFSDEQVCVEPNGLFNQCSFTCEGNPKGEKTCRTDLPGVACVRRLCRANGKWNEPARLPASGGGLCDPKKVVVSDCGTLW